MVSEDFTLDELYKIAEKKLNSYIKSNKVNALTAGIFTSENNIEKGYHAGRVEYVPNGNFSDAVM